jgi:cytochrome c oxidase cbb3-type subunit IV
MDVNELRIAVTVVSLVLFLALLVHTWSRRRRVDHEQAAWLPFSDEPPGPGLAPHIASAASPTPDTATGPTP